MSTILRLYSIVHVAMGTTKASNFTCQSKSFISIFSFTFQVSAFEQQPFSCHVLANDIYQEPITPAYTHKLPKLCSVTLTVICLSRMGVGSNRVSKWFLAEFPRHCSKKFYLDRKKITDTYIIFIFQSAEIKRFLEVRRSFHIAGGSAI